MTRRIGLILAGVLFVVLPLAGAASAQSYPPSAAQGQQVAPTQLTPGQPFTISGGGCVPGSTATVRFDNQVLGTVVVGSDGNFTGTFTTPNDAQPGQHNITSTCPAPDGTVLTRTTTVQVLAAAADRRAATPPATAAPGPAARAGTLPRTGTGLTMPLATSAALLIGAGTVAIIATRRRRQSA